MEFNWQERHYELYGIGNSTFKKNELDEKGARYKANIQKKQGKNVAKEHQGFTLNNQVKRLQSMMHTLQRNLTSAHIGNLVKPLELDKDDATKKTFSITKNPIYYASRTKHFLRGWQCNNHNNAKYNHHHCCPLRGALMLLG